MDSPPSQYRLLWTFALNNWCTAEHAEEAYAEIVRRYSEPHRHYHTFRHVIDVYVAMQEIAIATITAIPPSQRVPPRELLPACFLHDVIYDTRASDNEERSAEFARELLQGLGVGAELREETSRLILLTKTHQAAKNDRLGMILLDADLSILAAEPERYDGYAAAIRQEYDWVPMDQYRAGRRAVLTRFLERPAIYHTSVFKMRETQARANLAREIASLT